jgi:hypothetical protein
MVVRNLPSDESSKTASGGLFAFARFPARSLIGPAPDAGRASAAENPPSARKGSREQPNRADAVRSSINGSIKGGHSKEADQRRR